MNTKQRLMKSNQDTITELTNKIVDLEIKEELFLKEIRRLNFEVRMKNFEIDNLKEEKENE